MSKQKESTKKQPETVGKQLPTMAPLETRPGTLVNNLELTPEEMAVFQRARGEDDTWKTISEDEANDYSLAEDPFKLPEAAQKLKDTCKFAFRWVERTKERIDRIRSLDVPKRWWVVNASTVPELEKDIDPILGCVTKLDQLLVFKPWWMYEAERELKTQAAESKDQSGDMAKKHGIPIDDTGSQFLSGRKYKIGSGDKVQLHETEGDTETAVFEAGDDNSGLEDLIEN